MATFTISQLTAKPSTYTLVDGDVFVMTTGTTTPLLSTVKVTLDDIRTYYQAAGNEIRGSVWHTTNANSGTWDQAYLSVTTDLKNTSADWNNTKTTVNGNSANWTTGYTQSLTDKVHITDNVMPNSASWNSTHTSFKATSGDFLSGGDTVNSLGYGLSAWPSSSAVYTFNHAEGAAPGFIRGVAVCQTAEFNYSVGDEIGVEFIQSEYGTGGTKRRDRPACALVTNSVQISAIFAMGTDDESTSHGRHIIPNASNAEPDETLTPAKWNVKIYAGHIPVA